MGGHSSRTMLKYLAVFVSAVFGIHINEHCDISTTYLSLFNISTVNAFYIRILNAVKGNYYCYCNQMVSRFLKRDRRDNTFLNAIYILMKF